MGGAQLGSVLQDSLGSNQGEQEGVPLRGWRKGEVMDAEGENVHRGRRGLASLV